jgi:ATP-dependent Zn protease
MTNSSSEVVGAAYHEAGHVLVALHYGLDVGLIEVRENGDGGTNISSAEHLPLLDRVAVCMGGGAAQQHFQAPATDHAMMADYVMVYNLTPEMTDEEREEAIEKAFLRARSIIAQNADEVARLAKILITRRSIKLDEVQPPVRPKPPDVDQIR